MHLGKFADSMEFQSWKVNCKTEVCTRTADPQITMPWIKEVEIANTIDELMTSRSIVERTNFPDFHMLDAMIASALKKLLSPHVRFLKRVNVVEQRAQKYDRFLRERQIAHMICEHFRATGAYEAVQGPSDLFNVRFQNDDVRDFVVRWNQEVKYPKKILWKVYTSQNCRILFSFRLYWLCMCKRRFETTNHHSRLKTSVGLHIDQTMRTRNFRVRNEIVERGAVTKSLEGKKAYVERRVPP